MRTTNASVPDDLAKDENGRVARDGKTDTLRAADHRSVDADHLSGGRNERATRTARIERRIGLNLVVDEATAPSA